MLLLAVILLAVTIFNLSNEQRIKRKTQKGFAELLNYGSIIEDGIIVGKDGCLSVSYLYSCMDSDSASDDDKDLLVARINQTIARLGNGWILHIDCVRQCVESYSQPSESSFKDNITLAIDNERRKFFNNLGSMYESVFILTFTYLPDLLVTQKFLDFMYVKDKNDKRTSNRTDKILQAFKAKISELENTLSLVLNLERLHRYSLPEENGDITYYDSQLQHINYCVNCLLQPVRLPAVPVYLDALIAHNDFEIGTVPKIGNQYIKCISIDGFPSEAYSGILNPLSKLSCNYRWNTRFIFVSPENALAEINRHQRKWKQKTRGIFAQIFNLPTTNVNQDAVDMVADCDQFSAEINSGEVGSGFYTSTIILSDPNPDALQQQADFIYKEIMRLGFVARIETVNAVEAFLGSLPTDGYHNIRRPLIHTMNLAQLLPTSSIWTGSSQCPCPFYPENSPALMYCVTDGSSPFRFNIHVRDLGHTLIIGPTGAGKSTLLATIVAQLRRYRDMTIFAFDKGMSMYALNQACGGSHFEICADDSVLQFCPLQYNTTPSETEICAQWIISILQLNNINNTGIVTPEQAESVRIALNSMRENNTKTMSHFYNSCQDTDIKLIIKNYCGASMMGNILDGEKDNLELDEFTVFEMEEIMNQENKFKIPILLYLFNRIQNALHGQPTAIVLDEAWIMLANPVFKEKIREWLKVLRKANCAVIMATQSISDAAHSGILDVINESTATKIFLPNSTAKNEKNAELYSALGLNNKQIEIVANAVPKHDYYFVSSEGARLFSLALEKLTLAFVAVSDKETIALIKKLKKQHKDDWVNFYLAEKNLNLNDYLGK